MVSHVISNVMEYCCFSLMAKHFLHLIPFNMADMR